MLVVAGTVLCCTEKLARDSGYGGVSRDSNLDRWWAGRKDERPVDILEGNTNAPWQRQHTTLQVKFGPEMSYCR